MPSFGEYKASAAKWITLATGEFYPDALPSASAHYGPVLNRFREILVWSESSDGLFRHICEETGWMRVQLCRVFRKYVSPSTPVEMLKRKSDMEKILDRFGGAFRAVSEVREAFSSRPHPDEALCALLMGIQEPGHPWVRSDSESLRPSQCPTRLRRFRKLRDDRSGTSRQRCRDEGNPGPIFRSLKCRLISF